MVVDNKGPLSIMDTKSINSQKMVKISGTMGKHLFWLSSCVKLGILDSIILPFAVLLMSCTHVYSFLVSLCWSHGKGYFKCTVKTEINQVLPTFKMFLFRSHD